MPRGTGGRPWKGKTRKGPPGPNSAKASERARSFIADFYAQALAGVTLEWIESGMAAEPQAMVANVAKLLDGAIDTAIERFAR